MTHLNDLSFTVDITIVSIKIKLVNNETLSTVLNFVDCYILF